jgi:glycosyltransferase involved in cell wall biosynthesis
VKRVSVALATYNGERFLEAQLESLARQTFPPAELVVRDDRSTDRTTDILAEFARTSPFPVRVEVNEERLGVADNFIAAARACSGELVAFCDQDDVWLDEKLERCVACFDVPDVRLAIHAWTVVDEQLRVLGPVVPPFERSYVAPPLSSPKWGEAPGMAMVFDATLLRLLDWEARPAAHHEHGRLLHDEWIYGVGRVAGAIAFVAEPLVLYRQHEVNVEGAPDRTVVRRIGEAVTVGWEYYRRRADQARGWAQLLGGAGFEEEAASYRRLADLLGARSAAYEPDTSALRRLGRVGSALRRGVYGRRSRGGFGLRGIARDVGMICLGRR